jgi:CRISPR system Cascade subunit CasD
MPRHLVLRLEGPLLSFGAEAIDNFGVVRDFPAASMLVGLMANALGWRREDREAHQNLQDRLVFAARRDREGSRFTEFQTAQLDGAAQHWTTRGAVEGRRGGADTYKSPHLRYRDHDADAAVTVVLRLQQEAHSPNLDEIAHALQYPARPLFLGRKPCIPSQSLVARDPFVEADYLLAALKAVPLIEDLTVKPHRRKPFIRIAIPALSREMPEPGWAQERVADERNWLTGLHGGERRLFIRSIARQDFTNQDFARSSRATPPDEKAST